MDEDDEIMCALCGHSLDGRVYDPVDTILGPAHEECAEKRWPLDPGDTRYPR